MNNSGLKNTWLVQLKDFLVRETNIVGAIYFNVDLTNGLQKRTLGELDRSVIDFASKKFYSKILDVYNAGKPNEFTKLYYLFNVQRLTLNNKTFLIKPSYVKPIKDLYTFTTSYVKGQTEQLAFLDGTKKN